MTSFVKEGECIYAVFGVARDASLETITKHYRKLALTLHPDRHSGKPAAVIDDAKQKFQSMSYIYGILSNEERRARYDRTGSVSDAVIDDICDFELYFADLYKSCITQDAIDQFKKEYQGSYEEHCDILESYKTHEGNMDLIMEEIPCSTVEEDEARFREILTKAIADGLLTAFDAFTAEPAEKTLARRANAAKEAKEAAELIKELGVGDSEGNLDDIKAALMARQKIREETHAGFLEHLTDVYTTSKSKKEEENAPAVVATAENGGDMVNGEEQHDVAINAAGQAESSLDAAEAAAATNTKDVAEKKTPRRTTGSRSTVADTPTTGLRRSTRQAAAAQAKTTVTPNATPSKRRSSAPASATKRQKKA